jgi:uncharacterized protein YndB with AHSA1/START domain
MPPIVTTAGIDRPAARVFACATDPSCPAIIAATHPA